MNNVLDNGVGVPLYGTDTRKSASIVMNCPDDLVIRIDDNRTIYGSELFDTVQYVKEMRRYAMRTTLNEFISCSDVLNVIMEYWETSAPVYKLSAKMEPSTYINISVNSNPNPNAPVLFW
jgi:hypothetical protein